ncbi:MAG: ATP-binding protein [Candidatus Manganitrophus sp. SA1]|nr:ATP-binding protein [Candidatus Manganitrophus morganii]
MRLKRAQIREFKSIWDSNPFEIDRVACLVGKNEAGKSTILRALYRLNPIVEKDASFDITDDYPRSEVESYEQDIESGQRKHAIVVEATFELESPELETIKDEYGDGLLTRPEVIISKGYAKDEKGNCRLFVDVPIDEAALVKTLISKYDLPEPLKSDAIRKNTIEQLSKYLAEESQKQVQAIASAQAEANQIQDAADKAAALEKIKALAESEQAKVLRGQLTELLKQNLGLRIWETILKPYFPKFLYFDEYYQLRGHDNIQALKKRVDTGNLKRSDHPLLGLIDLARLSLDRLLSLRSTQDLKNRLQGASNYLSSQILPYWSQNKHLRMNFDVRPGLPNDPEGMTEGINIWGEVFDSKHLVSTGLGTRSAGFVWFFSFLAWYSAVKKKNEPLVLLLDEPGLSLHGRAQEDLLRYFEAEIVTNPKHQLIYTTHSPFMIDVQHWDRVRIVQDKGIDTADQLPREEDGTKVLTDVLDAGPDSLFPLQGALGYDIYQTLFIGPNSLVVEGASDLLYIQTISGILQGMGRVGLDGRWTITPVGGADKVPTFVALIGSQKKLKIATLIDFEKGNQQMIENIYRKKLLAKSHVLTFADFAGKKEADIEDMFDESFYIQLVNEEFIGSLPRKISLGDLKSRAPRILARLDEYLSENPLNGGAKFNHYRPARYFSERVSTLSIPADTLDRFETAFNAANVLLK